jgi:hypothetical protein
VRNVDKGEFDGLAGTLTIEMVWDWSAGFSAEYY